MPTPLERLQAAQAKKTKTSQKTTDAITRDRKADIAIRKAEREALVDTVAVIGKTIMKAQLTTNERDMLAAIFDREVSVNDDYPRQLLARCGLIYLPTYPAQQEAAK